MLLLPRIPNLRRVILNPLLCRWTIWGGTYVFPSGTVTGEVKHQLLLAEMPRHNHDDSTPPVVAGVPPADGNTSTAFTGIVINPNSTGVTVNLGPSGVTTAPHTHGSNAVGGQGQLGLCIADGTNTAISTDFTPGELNVHTLPRALDIYPNGVTIIEPNSGLGHNHGITDPQHAHTITDLGHRHTISSNGNSEYHNNMQPTIFYGNTFVYCGIPTTTNLVQANPNWQNSWPYAVPQSNPPLL